MIDESEKPVPDGVKRLVVPLPPGDDFERLVVTLDTRPKATDPGRPGFNFSAEMKDGRYQRDGRYEVHLIGWKIDREILRDHDARVLRKHAGRVSVSVEFSKMAAFMRKVYHVQNNFELLPLWVRQWLIEHIEDIRQALPERTSDRLDLIQFVGHAEDEAEARFQREAVARVQRERGVGRTEAYRIAGQEQGIGADAVRKRIKRGEVIRERQRLLEPVLPEMVRMTLRSYCFARIKFSSILRASRNSPADG